jgi:hypothetical protein
MSKTLTVYLAADTSKLSRGLRQGQSDLGMFEGAIGKLAGVMAGAFTVDKVIDFFQQSMQAALEDEKAVTSLNKTLQNMGFGSATSEVQTFIDAQQRLTGVADDVLRPSMDRLIRSSESVGEAQKMLKLAMDISAGSGKDLSSITDALGKAMDGSTTALGKLGLGIDKNIIASGDMAKITAVAAKTFEGQAAAAANTYQGQIDRVTVSVNEAKEAIGYALLNALTKASNAFGGANGLQAKIDNFGTSVADAINGVGVLTEQLDRASTSGSGTGKVFDYLKDKSQDLAWMWFDNLVPGLRTVYGYLQLLGRQGSADIIPATGTFFSSTSESAQGLTKSLAALDREALNVALDTRAAAEYQSWLDTQNKKTTGSANVLTDALKAQSDVISTTVAGLKDQTSELTSATKAVTDYAQTIAKDILGALDLGEAYKSQFDEAGKKTGQTLVDAFQAQVDQATWFGNVLNAIKAKGADKSLIEQIASLGPEVGGALGQQMLTEGLVPTINDKWVGVQETVTGLAMGLVPEFLLAGQEYALKIVDGTVEQISKEEKRLRQIGKNIGKPIGANIKAEIAAAVAEAVAAAEAAKSAAAAERAAQAAAANVVVTEQQVAQALNRLIVNSNARTGYQTAPATSPVFG